MFIILINYTKPIEEVNKVVAEHRAYLDEQYKEKKLFVSGRRNPPVGGVLISHLKNKEEIEKIISNDPYKLHDVADYEIIEFDAGKSDERFKPFME